MHKVGCRGLCARDVLVDIIVNDNKTTYQFIKPEMVERIVNEHIIKGNPVQEWAVSEDYHTFHNKQIKVVLSDCGIVDPDEIDSYLNVNGYEALQKVITKMSQQEIIDLIKKSGLRGRGGAGFPTGVKWDICSKESSSQKYIICNADEGDPGAFMDRSVIEGNPHAVIEGMTIGAYAIGADKGYVYIRAEYPLAVERLKNALKQARAEKFPGEKYPGDKIQF